MGLFEKTEEIYKILNPTYKKYCEIRDDYLGKTKINGDPYTYYEAEKIAMDKVKFEIFGALKPFSSTGSKVLDWGAGKYQKHVEGEIIKSSQTWEEYFNSSEYLNSNNNSLSNFRGIRSIDLDNLPPDLAQQAGTISDSLNIDINEYVKSIIEIEKINNEIEQLRELQKLRKELTTKFMETYDPEKLKELRSLLDEVDKKIYSFSDGGFGGGGSSPGSEMTEDQYSEYLKDYFHDPEDPNETYYRNKLKEDPSVNRMHYDPSQMTEGQQAEYLNDYFHDPSMTEDQEYERLKEFFDATYDSREDISNAIGAIGQNMKGAFTPDADFKIGIEQNVLSSADFYDPVTEMMNYDPTKRVDIDKCKAA